MNTLQMLGAVTLPAQDEVMAFLAGYHRSQQDTGFRDVTHTLFELTIPFAQHSLVPWLLLHCGVVQKS